MTTEYNEDGWSIEVVRYYICGCGETFTGKSYYNCQECYEIVDPIPIETLQQKMYNRG